MGHRLELIKPSVDLENEYLSYYKEWLDSGEDMYPWVIEKDPTNFNAMVQFLIDNENGIPGPVTAEVVGLTIEEMLNEAHEIAKWAPNVVVKLPLTEAGLEAAYNLKQEGIKTNVTLVFSAAQGLMAAKAGATFISPFIGRLDDIGVDGMILVRDLRTILDTYRYETEIIAASNRGIAHVEQAALAGPHIATIPGSLVPSLWKHPLTDIGIERFLKDWESVPKT